MMSNKQFDQMEKEGANLVRLAMSIFVIAAILCGMALLGYMEKQDNDLSEKYYCQMVHDGMQSDYNGSYKQGKCPQSGESTK